MTHPPDFIPDPNPNGLQVFSIVALGRVDDALGPDYWWFEARTACGRTIAAVGPECAGQYEVVVTAEEGGVCRHERHYTGGEGSDAERVFKMLQNAIEAESLRRFRATPA